MSYYSVVVEAVTVFFLMIIVFFTFDCTLSEDDAVDAFAEDSASSAAMRCFSSKEEYACSSASKSRIHSLAAPV